MIEPTKDDIGRTVIYVSYQGAGRQEDGVITSFNDRFVFVRYRGDLHAKATRRESLEWAHG